jgi:hypothetical protein
MSIVAKLIAIFRLQTYVGAQSLITGIKRSWFCNRSMIGNRVAYITSIDQIEYPHKSFVVI